MKNPENLKTYLEVLDGHSRLVNDRDKSYYSYIKSLSQILVGLLALLIGLKPSSDLDQTPKVLFLISIALVGLSILSSQALLFYEIFYLESEVKAYLKKLEEIYKSEEKVAFPWTKIKPLKFFSFFEKLTFYCFLLSIISLIAYCYFFYFSCGL